MVRRSTTLHNTIVMVNMMSSKRLNVGTIGHVDHNRTTLGDMIRTRGLDYDLIIFDECDQYEGREMKTNTAALMAIVALSMEHQPQAQFKRVVPAKQCLNCNMVHGHNNAFCSAECCKKYKS